MKKGLTSLEKGLDILSAFDLSHPELSAVDISQRLGLPLSSTYKYIELLSRKGFLARKTGTRKFTLGIMIPKLGYAFSSSMNLIDIAIPHMRSLSKLSGETVLLTVVNGWDAVCIEKVETDRLIRLSLEKGISLPLHAGASSKILMAYKEDAFLEDMFKYSGFKSFTKNTITELNQLKREMKKIRKEGYAFSDSEVDLMARAISAPIFDHKGNVTSGLTVAGPAHRLTDELIPVLVGMVKEGARAISWDLGYDASDASPFYKSI